MKWLFSFQSIFPRLLVSLLLLAILTPWILVSGIVHANDTGASFSLRPTFFPHPNARPRAYFIYDSTPTAVVEDSVEVRNVGTARGTVDLYPVDAITASSGGTAFANPGQKQHDVGAWINLSASQVTLNPGQSLNIPFRVTIPAHVRPGQHGGGILAEDLNQPSQSAQSRSRTAFLHFQKQEIIGILINLPGTHIERLNATHITYDVQSTYQRVLIDLQNTGTQLLHPTGSFQITDMAGQQLQQAPLNLDTFLPQTSIAYPFYIQQTTLQPGVYTAKLHLTYEGNHSLNYEASIVVPLPTNNTKIGQVISHFVTPNTNFFSSLTLADYIVGGIFTFLSISSLFFWGRQLYSSAGKLKRRRNREI